MYPKFPISHSPGIRLLLTCLCTLLFQPSIVRASPIFEPVQAFDRSPETPQAKLFQTSDGNFYGTTSAGGSGGSGTVFKMTPAGAVTVLVNFTGANGSGPRAGVVLGSDGMFYGTTAGGGSNSYGTVFKMTPAGDLTTLFSFSGANGSFPNELVLGNDGDFYGTTAQGGSGGLDDGTVFKMTAAGALTTLVNFNRANGSNPYAALIQGSDGNLYGTTSSSENGYGTVFKMTLSGDLTTLVSFTYYLTNQTGTNPGAGLVQGSDGNFYGTTRGGIGIDNWGSVFRMTPAGVLTTLGIVVSPVGELVLGSDGNFYGTDSRGIFRMTPVGELATLVTFTGANGSAPRGTLVQGGDGNFYGTTSAGGSAGNGTVYRVTPVGDLTTLVNFGSPNGRDPRAGLVLGSNGSFYGTTSAGGSNNSGAVFKITSAGVVTNLVSIPKVGPALFLRMNSGLVRDNAGDFYGTTGTGGSNGGGSVYKVTEAGVLTTLASFTGANGRSPQAGLALGSDGSFYGTTSAGGESGLGTIFKMTTAGELLTLVSFSGTNGSSPQARLLQASDGDFYGTTFRGGDSDLGTIFKITPSGSLTVLAHFTGADGSNPRAGLVQASDGNFYGTTGSGGSSGYGTVFKMTSTGGLISLVSFAGADGRTPFAELLQGSDGSFYGTTSAGGSSGDGTVFQVSAAGDLTTLLHFSGTNGRNSTAGLVRGNDGHLYGTTRSGGTTAEGQQVGGGQIFRLRMGPAVATVAASSITPSEARLNATVNPGGHDTPVSLQYGTHPSLDAYTTVSAGTTIAGPDPVPASAALTGLPANTVFYYRAVASNAENTIPQTGEILSFTTANSPPTFLGYQASTAYQTVASLSFAKLLSKADDPDGDPLTVTAVGISAHGASIVKGGTAILYTPLFGFSGSDTFSVTITDARGAAVDGTVTVAVRESTSSGGLGVNPVALTVLAGGHMGIAFQGIPTRTYLVQRSTNLNTWQTLATLLADATGRISYTDESPPNGSAFYRLAKP